MEKFGEDLKNPQPSGRPGKPEQGPADPDRRVFIEKGLLIGSGVALSLAAGAGLVDFFSRREKNHRHGPEDISSTAAHDIGQKPRDTAARREKPSLPEKKFLDSILDIYHQLSSQEAFFPKNIFSTDFLIAQQIQESNYQPAAVSSAEAYGVMQTRDIAVLDVHRYLKILNRKNNTDYAFANYDEKLSGLDLKIIQEYIKKYPDYSRALGKIFLMCLHGQDGYAIGRKTKNSVNAQKEILLAYNGGTSILKRKKSPAYKIAKEYADAIIKLKDIIGMIRRKAKERKIFFDNYQVAKLAISSRGKKQVENYIDEFLDYYKNNNKP
ncbi:hypothetical protein COX22_00640 [Candidatus Falkowbacteria bacterium CG23_combo_of_CG06-09_8_20_14_all_49_15]|uniref:Transglycosylase SLT domain-containing protein n=1 Tax=Candidatus Falkowbacteria bacterium CG23_combo_of_CG06-09_8_20_14_all_49_15 TaxID=1974572 RepID=A0A2G9ZLW4_9BACT|nr:MAG: hypothetical protein COX22_00640 [Candidatus Falkowbacteria bacterium CG23_combo_of_CG06-09_8_20_14_all_49_15]